MCNKKQRQPKKKGTKTKTTKNIQHATKNEQNLRFLWYKFELYIEWEHVLRANYFELGIATQTIITRQTNYFGLGIATQTIITRQTIYFGLGITTHTIITRQTNYFGLGVTTHTIIMRREPTKYPLGWWEKISRLTNNNEAWAHIIPLRVMRNIQPNQK